MKTYKSHFIEKESDVTIISESNSAIERAKKSFFYQRNILEKYAYKNKNFLTSFSPIRVDSDKKIIKIMAEAGYICDVGPMASVAGAIADIMVEIMQQEG